MAKKLLIIGGNPTPNSLTDALADAYIEGAKSAGAQLRRIDIRTLTFEPNLKNGYKEPTPLEPDLIKAAEDILWSDHMVWIYPIWWGGAPAQMKGFIDRVFIPKVMCDHDEKGNRRELLKGRTARLIQTMEQPLWIYRTILRSVGVVQMKYVTLGFCGVRGVKTTCFGEIMNSTKEQRTKWIEKVRKIGEDEGR
jgi:putative NADPH-quinone reductase